VLPRDRFRRCDQSRSCAQGGKRPGETCIDEARLHITDPEASEHRIEWLRFEEDSPLPEVLKTTAHVAYVVDDLDAVLVEQDVLLEPFTPMEGVRVAFILDDGAPIAVSPERLVTRVQPKSPDKVALVTLGGAGHEPALSGFVGEGMLDIIDVSLEIREVRDVFRQRRIEVEMVPEHLDAAVHRAS